MRTTWQKVRRLHRTITTGRSGKFLTRLILETSSKARGCEGVEVGVEPAIFELRARDALFAVTK